MKIKASNHKPTQEQIAQRAYAIFEQGGRVPGRDLENWSRAKRELSGGNGQESKPQGTKTNGKATTHHAVASTRSAPRLERKYA